MQLKVFTGVALAMILGGVLVNRTRPREAQFPTPALRTVYEMPVGTRKLRIYAVHQNLQGEILLVFTAGKTPQDALVPDAKGVLRVRDSSVTTQDWVFVAKNSQGQAAPATVHLPFQGRWGVDRQIVPARIAPDGFKYEAIAFRFGQGPQLQYDFEFYCPNTSLHGPALWAAAKKTPTQKRKSQAQLVFSEQGLLGSVGLQERVPAYWSQYGVDVSAAVRQLEERD